MGKAANQAEIKWCCRIYLGGGTNPYNCEKYSKEKYGTETKIKSWQRTPESIYPDLKLSENEAKIIIEHKFETTMQSSRMFGFYPIDPFRSHSCIHPFNSIVIFSPIPRTFSRTILQ